MARQKYDGVVEAVHYTPDGQVAWVRAYLRTGPIFSDRVLLDRQMLIDHLKNGKSFYTGKRIERMGGNFEVDQSVRLVERNGKRIIVAGDSPVEREHLEGVPVI